MKKLMFVGILLLTVCTGVGIAGVPCAILPAPAGWSMIANPCDGGATLIDAFLPDPPVMTEVWKFNGVTFDPPDVYAGGGVWVPGLITLMTLSPGEGAFINLPVAAALGF